MKNIIFRCPACNEEMEIGAHMAGQEVQCVECQEWIDVPRKGGGDRGLTSNQWLLFTLLFLFIPAVNVVASSVLYYVWKKDYPRCANQINLLGFLIFGFHALVYALFWFVLLRTIR